MKETGIVYSIKDDEVLVRLKRRAACMGCRACSIGSGGDMIIKTVTSENLKVGDMVAIEIDSASIIKAILFIYLFPTVSFLVGLLAGLRIIPLLGIDRHKEIISLLTGLLLLSVSLFLARWYGIRRTSSYQAKITDVIKAKSIGG